MAKSRRGCWTCKARKVRCDEDVPTCRRCNQSGRECEGYGPRLSWPRDNDGKRAIRVVLPVTAASTRMQIQLQMQMRKTAHGPFVNTTWQDVELYRHLSLPDAPRPSKRGSPDPKIWRQPRSEATHGELLYYFREAAHHSLTTFNPATSQIRDVIMSMVFASDTVSRRALFYALLAFASLHRSGPHRGAVSFKVAALEALSASAEEAAQGSAEAAAQHVAACMILCAFETLLPLENSGEWLCYIRGAMEIAKRGRLRDRGDSDLLDWVYFHDCLSRFTLSHWRHEHLAVAPTDAAISPVPLLSKYSPLDEGRTISLSQGSPYAVLNVLSEVCDVLLDPSDPRTREVEYRDRLRALKWKVDNLPSASSTALTPAPAPSEPKSDLEVTAELHWIATRVYLARASQDPLEPLANLDSLIDATFAGPVQACYCRHFFPLLIIACEARTDEHRAAILNLIDRTEKHGYVRSMESFRAQVQSFWIQHDLHADDDRLVNYRALMKTVISSDRALPSYV